MVSQKVGDFHTKHKADTGGMHCLSKLEQQLCKLSKFMISKTLYKLTLVDFMALIVRHSEDDYFNCTS